MHDGPFVPNDRRALLAGIGGLAAGTFLSAGRAEAGPLVPPGPPAPTPGPEPRIAVNATNTPGNAGAVYRITASGSYYLTSNVIGEAGKHGVLISAVNVTLDLNGFALIGIPGAVNGIDSTRQRICVHNGHLQDWPGSGLALTGQGTKVMGVTVFSCEVHGIQLGVAGLVTNCIAAKGTGTCIGFQVGYGSTIRDCSSTENGGRGILTTTSCVVVDTVATGCQLGGIEVGGGTTVSNCAATFNTEFNIRATGLVGGLISGNIVSGNLVGDGIGIDVVGSNYRIDGNHLTRNKIGLRVSGSSNRIIRNSASGNTVQSYNIVAGNSVGPIGVAATATSPWANLQ